MSTVFQPPIYNFPLAKGKPWNFQFTYNEPDTESGELGNPIDLTGYSCTMKFRRKVEDEDILLTLSSDDDEITLTDQGVITIHATTEQTLLLIHSNVYYGIKLKPPATDEEEILVGLITVSWAVTRD